jgi:holo-[acyl-carrier protein] synthase
MLRAGIDLIEVGRIQAALAQYGERFTRRVYTDAEIAYCAGRATSFAARFAAKEAVSKLLGVGIQHRDGVDWREIEVVSAENGDPSLKLYGKAKRRAQELGIKEIALSFSHTHEHAIAFVVGQ